MLATPQLKLAIVDLPKIFDAYYKTPLAQAELDASKGDKTAYANKMRALHNQIEADLQQVILTYSINHDLDLVIDVGNKSRASGVPVVLYSRPELDNITDGVIALANAGHEGK